MTKLAAIHGKILLPRAGVALRGIKYRLPARRRLYLFRFLCFTFERSSGWSGHQEAKGALPEAGPQRGSSGL